MTQVPSAARPHESIGGKRTQAVDQSILLKMGAKSERQGSDGGSRRLLLRCFGWGLLGLFVLALASLWVVPQLLNWNHYKSDIADLVYDATGRKLTIAGDLELSLSAGLTVSIKASDLRLSNPPDWPHPIELPNPTDDEPQPPPENFATIQAVTAEFPLLSTLAGDIHVDLFHVQSPQIALIAPQTGEPNWHFIPPTNKSSHDPTPTVSLGRVRLEDVRLSDGRISYENQRNGHELIADELSMQVAMPDAQSPASLLMRAKVNGKPVTLDLSVENPAALEDALNEQVGPPTQVTFSLKSTELNAGMNLTVTGAASPDVVGKFHLTAPSMQGLASWLGRPLAEEHPDRGPVSATLNFNTTERRLVTKGSIQGKGLDVAISASYQDAGEQEAITFDISGNELDLDLFLPAPQSKAALAAGSVPTGVPHVFNSLPAAPLAFTKLRGKSVQGKLSIASGRVRGLSLKNLGMDLDWADGVLAANLASVSVSGGTAHASLSLDGSGPVLQVNAATDISGIHLGRLFQSMGQHPLIGGIASGHLKLSAAGNSPRDLVTAAEGTMNFALHGDMGLSTLRDLRVAAKLSGQRGPAKLDASFNYEGRRVGVSGLVETTALSGGTERLNMSADVVSDLGNIEYRAHVPLKRDVIAKGHLSLRSRDAGALALWLAPELRQSPSNTALVSNAKRLDLALTAKEDGTGTLVGNLQFRKHTLVLDGSVDSFAAMVKGRNSPARGTLAMPGANVTFEGSIATHSWARTYGAFKVTIPSPRALLKALDIRPPDKGPPLSLFSDVNIHIAGSPGSQPTRFLADWLYSGDPMHVRGQLGLDDAMTSKLAPASFSFDGGPFRLSYAGKFRTQPPTLAGELNLAVPSIKKLRQWMGNPDTPIKQGVVHVSTVFDARAGSVSIESLQIKAPGFAASGSGTFRDGPISTVHGQLDITDADLNQYLTDPTLDEQRPKAPVRPEKPAASTPWSTAPIDWSPLSSVQGSVGVTVTSLTYGRLITSGAHLSAQLKDRRLTLLVDDTQIADGTAEAHINLNSAVTPPRLSYSASLKKVPIEPLLEGFADTGRLRGTLYLDVKGRTRGNSVAELVAGLEGDGHLQIQNGALSGVSVAATLRKAGTLSLARVSPAQSTPFGDLVFDYTMKSGVLSSGQKQLSLTSPLLTIDGTGDINFPKRTLDYHLVAELLKTPGEKGMVNPLANLGIPISVTGMWNQPKFHIDWVGVFEDVATSPLRVEALPDNLRKYAETLGVSLITAPVDLLERAVE